MTHVAGSREQAGAAFPLPAAVQAARRASALRWLDHPVAYTIGTAVLSFLSIGTSLLAPSLLGPAAFGSFALLSSLFQYASKFDLGLSQLADRDLAAKAGAPTERGAEILYANWAIGLIMLLLVAPVAAFVAARNESLLPLDTALAVSSGALAMIANAPVTLFRAGAQVWEFTATALALQAGMTGPRLAGLVVGGITGCFAVLVVWYGILALGLARAALPARGRISSVPSLVRAALPLFLFNALWFAYLTANRWISATLSSPEDLGFFAFGANLAFVGLGMISTIAQVYYPKLLASMARTAPGAYSSIVERQTLLLGVALSAIALFAVFTADKAVALLFPHFEQAVPATIAMAVSCISLGVATWLVPMAIAVSPHPVRDAALTLGPGLLILPAAMFFGDRLAGIEGQAWACAVAGLALIACLMSTFCRLGILTSRTALRIYVLQVVLAAFLSGLAFIMSQSRATPVTGPAETAPPPGWTLVFEDNFDTLRLWDGQSSGLWEPHYPWGGRTNPSNEELQYYVDPRPDRDADVVRLLNPFHIKDGSLAIRARPFPHRDQVAATGLAYASGLLTTARSFSFTYGYVEIRARVPRGRGLWSAFWLAPTDQSWPPELDVMEVLGHDTRTNVATAHTRHRLGYATQTQIRIPTPDLSEEYHTFALKWTAETTVWYFDGRPVASLKTPADMHKPMYLIVNLAVGGSWPGSPDASTPFPADLHIDSIRVFLPRSTAEVRP